MMFWYGNGNAGWHPWIAIVLWLGMLAFWVLVAWGVVKLFRSSGPASRGHHSADPEQILKERLARGEINAEEYERLRALIRT